MADSKRVTISLDPTEPRHTELSSYLDRITGRGAQTELVVSLAHLYLDLEGDPNEHVKQLKQKLHEKLKGKTVEVLPIAEPPVAPAPKPQEPTRVVGASAAPVEARPAAVEEPPPRRRRSLEGLTQSQSARS